MEDCEASTPGVQFSVSWDWPLLPGVWIRVMPGGKFAAVQFR